MHDTNLHFFSAIKTISNTSLSPITWLINFIYLWFLYYYVILFFSLFKHAFFKSKLIIVKKSWFGPLFLRTKRVTWMNNLNIIKTCKEKVIKTTVKRPTFAIFSSSFEIIIEWESNYFKPTLKVIIISYHHAFCNSKHCF